MKEDLQEYLDELWSNAVYKRRDWQDLSYLGCEVIDPWVGVLSCYEQKDVQKAIREYVDGSETHLASPDKLYDWIWREVEERWPKKQQAKLS